MGINKPEKTSGKGIPSSVIHRNTGHSFVKRSELRGRKEVEICGERYHSRGGRGGFGKRAPKDCAKLA